MLTLFRTKNISKSIENSLLYGLSNFSYELDKYNNSFTGLSLSFIGERQALSMLLSIINDNRVNLNAKAFQELKSKNKKFNFDFIIIDENTETLVFESKMWVFNGKFNEKTLLENLSNYAKNLQNKYIPNLPFEYKKVNYAVLLFEYVENLNDLISFRKNIENLYNANVLDFYFEYILQNEAIILYGQIK